MGDINIFLFLVFNKSHSCVWAKGFGTCSVQVKGLITSNKGKLSQGIFKLHISRELVVEGTFLKTCRVDCTSVTIINHSLQAQSTRPFPGEKARADPMKSLLHLLISMINCK